MSQRSADRFSQSPRVTRRQIVQAAAGAALLTTTRMRRGQARQLDALPTPREPTNPPGAPRAGQRLLAGAAREPDSLHPWLASTVAAFDVLEGVMDGLLRYTSEGKLKPALAEGFSLSDDGLTYTFKLRQGVRYHNGEPFQGEDFVAAWRLAQDREFGVLNILGWQKVASARVPDSHTLIVRTSEPYAPFLSTVATTYLCPRSALEQGIGEFRDAFGSAPIGTGPFRVASWEPGVGVTLERWEEYWGAPALLDGIDYLAFADQDALLAALLAGELDVAAGAGALPPEMIAEVAAEEEIDLFRHGTMNWQHIDLKQMAFLRETAVRQALDFATPRPEIIADLLSGGAMPAFADQAPDSWAYDEGLKARPYDPAQAEALLEEARLIPGDDGVRARDGVRLEIDLWGVAGDARAKAILDRVAAAWNEIGVSTLVQTAPADQLWGPLGYQFSDRMTGCLYTWTNANDPDDLFYWHSSQIPTSPGAAGGNLPAFFYPYSFQEEIDQLTIAAALTLDFVERQELYAEIQQLLAEEVPVIFLYWEEAFPAVRQDVGGFWPSAWTPLLWNAADWYIADPSATPVPESTATAVPTATQPPATPVPTATPRVVATPAASPVPTSAPIPEPSATPTAPAGPGPASGGQSA